MIRIILLALLVASVQAATFDRYVPDRMQSINVKMPPYSAYGNGAADDSAALQAAFDAGAGKSVYIPPGIFRYSTSLYIHPGTTVYGEGTLQQATISASVHLTNNCTLDGLTIDGGYPTYGSNTWPYGEITLYPRGTNVTIQRTWIKNSQGSAIASDAVVGLKVLGNTLYDWRDHGLYISTDSSNMTAQANYLYCLNPDANFEAIKSRKIRGGVTLNGNFGEVPVFYMNEDDTNGYPSFGFVIVNNNVGTKYHALLFASHYSTNFANGVNISGNYFYNYNAPTSYTPFSFVWNERPGVKGALVQGNIFNDYKDWGNLYYATGLSNALENVTIRGNTYNIGPKVNQTGSQLWISYATNIAFENNTIIDDGTNALAYPVLFGGPAQDIRLKGNTIRRSNPIRLQYFVAFATNNHAITAQIENNTFDIRYRLAYVTSTNQPGSGSLIKFLNNKWTSDYGNVMPYDNSIATTASRWSIDIPTAFDGGYTFNISTNPGVPGSYVSAMTLDTNKLATFKGNLLMGATSGTAYPQITMNSGDSASGIAMVDMGTPNRQYRITVGASPYPWNLSYIGNAAQAVTNGSAQPMTNIIVTDIKGQVGFATNIGLASGRITTTNITIGTTNTWPSLTSGASTPTAAEPAGSLYLKTDGSTYVRTNSVWVLLTGSGGNTYYTTNIYNITTNFNSVTFKKLTPADNTYTIPTSESNYTYLCYGNGDGSEGWGVGGSGHVVIVIPAATNNSGLSYSFTTMPAAQNPWTDPANSTNEVWIYTADGKTNMWNPWDRKLFGGTNQPIILGAGLSTWGMNAKYVSDGTNWHSVMGTRY